MGKMSKYTMAMINLFQLRAEVKKKWEVSNRLKKKNSKQQKANSSSGEQLQKVISTKMVINFDPLIKNKITKIK